MTAEVVRLRPPMHRVSPRALWYWAARAALLWIVLLAPQVIWWFADTDRRVVSHVIVAVLWAVLAAVHLVVMPQWRYRVHRWEVTGEAVYTQAGWLKQQWRIAPVSRIQTVDIERDPFEQLFGLAKITVTTASAAGPLRISGLRHDRALELADELTKTTQAIRGDAT
jgi:membrane protein YdbS with pleckstrin-like domain